MSSQKIVWIDDDYDIFGPAIQQLQKLGMEFTFIRTLSDVTDQIDEILTHDLIILDLILPKGKSEAKGEYLGFDVIKILKEEFHVEIPILVFSIVANNGDVTTKLEEYGIPRISKTEGPNALKEIVFDLLNNA